MRGGESVSKLTREIVLRAGLQADRGASVAVVGRQRLREQVDSAKPMSGQTTPDNSSECNTLNSVQRVGNRAGFLDETASKHSREQRQCGTPSRSAAQKLTVQPRELTFVPTLSQPGSKVSHRSQSSRQTSRHRAIASTPLPASSSRSDSVARLAQFSEYQQVTGQAASKSHSTKSRDNHLMGESPQVVQVAFDEAVRGVRQTFKAKPSASHSRELPLSRLS